MTTSKPGTHTDQRCADCQKANPIIRPFVNPPIWYCSTCSSVLCEHTAISPTSYGNAICKFHDEERKARKARGE